MLKLINVNIKMLNFKRINKKNVLITCEINRKDNTKDVMDFSYNFEKDRLEAIDKKICYILNEKEKQLIKEAIRRTDKEIIEFFKRAKEGKERIRIYLTNPLLIVSESQFASKNCFEYINDLIRYLIAEQVKWFDMSKSIEEQLKGSEGYLTNLISENEKIFNSDEKYFQITLRDFINYLKKI